MEQLSSMDHQFLAVENATNTGHVGGLYLLDPSATPGEPLTISALKALVADRIHLAPPLRRRLLEVPLRLDRPYWIVVDPHLSDHVFEHRLDPPGDDRALAALIARLHATALNRTRPLWELHLIHGLAAGKQAVYGKVHHAAVDGVSGGSLLGVLLDRTATGSAPSPDAPAPEVDAPPRRCELLRRALVNVAAHPGRRVRSIPRLLPHRDALPGALRAPPTPFNAPVSARRSFAFASVPVRDVRAVRTAFGCSDNDVVLALCAAVLRTWLIEARALPESPLVVGVPVSLRPRSAQIEEGRPTTAGGNRLSLMVVALPTHEADPAQRLRAVAAELLAAKRRLSAMPDDWLNDVTDLVPAVLAGVTARSVGRVMHRIGRHPMNLVVSHVPGPHIPLYLAGTRMRAHYPVSAVTDVFGGLNITVVGHDGDLDFGFVACPELIPDVWAFADALPAALAGLMTAAA